MKKVTKNSLFHFFGNRMYLLGLIVFFSQFVYVITKAQEGSEKAEDLEFKTQTNAGMSKREYIEYIDQYLSTSFPKQIKSLEDKLKQAQVKIEALEAELKLAKEGASDQKKFVLSASDEWQRLAPFDPTSVTKLQTDFNDLVTGKISTLELQILSLNQGLKAVETVLSNVSGAAFVAGQGNTFAPTTIPAKSFAPTSAPVLPGSGSASGNGSGSGAPTN